MRTVSIALGFGWILAACSAPPSAVPPASADVRPTEADLRKAEAELVADVKRFATGYPDIQVTDIRFARGLAVGCAVVRDGVRPPHAVITLDDDPSDEARPVSMPFLTRPGSWEDPRNVAMSDDIRGQCRRMGAAID